jgi:hypothetical protein
LGLLSECSGTVLWEESKRIINQEKDYLKSTMEAAFEIFRQGITRQSQEALTEHSDKSPN